MARISKRVREEAIEALLCAADRCANAAGRWLSLGAATGYEVPDVAYDAWTALVEAAPAMLREEDGSDYLEAAALLRDGWSPGDPVHLIAKGK